VLTYKAPREGLFLFSEPPQGGIFVAYSFSYTDLLKDTILSGEIYIAAYVSFIYDKNKSSFEDVEALAILFKGWLIT